MGLFDRVYEFFTTDPPTKPEDNFTPTFEKHEGVNPGGGTVPLNPFYYATETTADWMMKKFGAASFFFKKEGWLGGADQPQKRFLEFPKGSQLRGADGASWITDVSFTENAGLLAAFYARNPPSKYKDRVFNSLAERFVWAALRAKHEAIKNGALDG